MYIRVMRMMIDGDDVIVILLAICHFYRQYHHHRPRPCDFDWEEMRLKNLMTAKSKVQTGPARCFQKHKAREGGKWRHFEGNCGIFANWRLIDLASPKSIVLCAITIQ